MEAKTNGGNTALRLAAQGGHAAAIAALVAAGAGVDAKDNHGATALMIAAEGGQRKAKAAAAQGSDGKS